MNPNWFKPRQDRPAPARRGKEIARLPTDPTPGETPKERRNRLSRINTAKHRAMNGKINHNYKRKREEEIFQRFLEDMNNRQRGFDAPGSSSHLSQFMGR